MAASVMSKQELVLSQLTNKAASGNEKIFKLFMEMMARFPPEAAAMRIDHDDQKFWAAFLARSKQLDEV